MMIDGKARQKPPVSRWIHPIAPMTPPVPPASASASATGSVPGSGSVPAGDAASAAAAEALVASLRRMGLVGAGQPVQLTPLTGGVSSDIYRVDVPGRRFCVKRALARLKVAADWQAPVERNRWEVEWMRVAAGIVPAAVPEVLGEDRAAGCFAMAYLGPDDHPIWKALLRDGVVEPATAAAVGAVLGRIHAATADRTEIAARFRTDDIFHAIRLEPYLVATARAHPDLAGRLEALVEVTRTTRRVLVHGDFSPKNILVGPAGPVILDAECAWYGDPAFDLAFVLNHLLLKGAWQPQWRDRYLTAFVALVSAYIEHVAWEPPAALEARTAALLPGLMLGRIDGKSPVEYLTADADRDAVRAFARALLVAPVDTLGAIAGRWAGGRQR
jgi:aminoglycoside phosphotransferase (APT) family kinase protein